MRQESRVVAAAFLKRRPCKRQRTHTDGETLYLHHNAIAKWLPDGSLMVTLAGWGTTTTRDRLNTLFTLLFGERPFHQTARVQYFDYLAIDAHDQILVPLPVIQFLRGQEAIDVIKACIQLEAPVLALEAA